jgi:hypothetical protein
MPNGRRDEGAPLPAANPRIESVDQFIVQTYVQTDGHSLAHSRGFAASIGGSALALHLAAAPGILAIGTSTKYGRVAVEV